ncbi:hypothetical protein CRG98_039686, partial [Punica granatum]
MLPRASFLLRFTSPLKVSRVSPLSPLTRASCKSTGHAPSCILSSTLYKSVESKPSQSAESAHSCFLQIYRACSLVHPFFYRSQVRRVCSLVLLANLPGLLPRASFLLRFTSPLKVSRVSPLSMLTRASCKSAGLARQCILSFTHRKFAESANSCFLQICRGCTAVHPFFYRSQVRRVRSLVLLANLLDLLANASFLLRIASSPSPLTHASCKYAGAAPLCILSSTVRKFAESAHSCFLQICGACSPVHPFRFRKFAEFADSCSFSLVLLANLSSLLAHASFLLRFASSTSQLTRASCKSTGPARLCILLRFASSPSPLTRASCKSAGCARPCILSFMLPKCAESAHWCFLQIYRICSPCILSFKLRKFAESAHSCFLQICRGCTAVHPFFYRSQVRRVRPLVLLANLRGLLACASFYVSQVRRVCFFVLLLRKFAESAHSSLLQICQGCFAVHPFFYASQ